jgi:hypothetical protein
MTLKSKWALLIGANALIYCVLSFYQSSPAAPANPKLPFANSVEQRMEMVGELREIKQLLQEQNKLLSQGKIRVVVEQR